MTAEYEFCCTRLRTAIETDVIECNWCTGEYYSVHENGIAFYDVCPFCSAELSKQENKK